MEKEREKYEAWFYYLRDLPEYEAFCDWIREKQKTPDSPWPGKEPPLMGLRMTFDFFGDIFNVEFEDWYKNRKDKDPGIGIMEYGRQQAQYEIDKTIKEFVNSYGREPSLNEFRENYLETLFNHLPASFLIRVHLHPTMSTKDLQVQFGKLARDKRESPNIEEWENEISKGWLPVGERIFPERLLKFLRVRQLEDEGLNFGEIEYELNPDGNEGEDPATNYGNKARGILENVKTGTFPGKYTEDSEPNKKT